MEMEELGRSGGLVKQHGVMVVRFVRPWGMWLEVSCMLEVSGKTTGEEVFNCR